jgi:hypothetical protein
VVSNGSPTLPDEVLSVLHEAEPALAFAWARVPKFGTQYLTFYPIGVAIDAVDLVKNRRHMARLPKATAGAQFPLDRTMAMIVTPNRLLIWKAHRHPRRIGEFLGEVSRTRIAKATVPFSNSGPWKTVRISLTNAARLQFQVSAEESEQFVSVLDKTDTD